MDSLDSPLLLFSLAMGDSNLPSMQFLKNFVQLDARLYAR